MWLHTLRSHSSDFSRAKDQKIGEGAFAVVYRGNPKHGELKLYCNH